MAFKGAVELKYHLLHGERLGGGGHEENSGHLKCQNFLMCPTIVPEKDISTYHGGALSK